MDELPQEFYLKGSCSRQNDGVRPKRRRFQWSIVSLIYITPITEYVTKYQERISWGTPWRENKLTHGVRVSSHCWRPLKQRLQWFFLFKTLATNIVTKFIEWIFCLDFDVSRFLPRDTQTASWLKHMLILFCFEDMSEHLLTGQYFCGLSRTRAPSQPPLWEKVLSTLKTNLWSVFLKVAMQRQASLTHLKMVGKINSLGHGGIQGTSKLHKTT